MLAALIDDQVWEASPHRPTGLADQVAAWKEADQAAQAAAGNVPDRALLVAMVLCSVTGQPMLATAFVTCCSARSHP